VLSVDWRMDMAALQQKFGRRIALQGNIDPCVLLSSRDAIVHSVQKALRQTNGRGHILNLGHGILPETPVENALSFIRAGQSAQIKNLSSESAPESDAEEIAEMPRRVPLV
jgi:uroporphyrinogen decarboxylase